MECTSSLETEKHSINNTRSSADADKPARRGYRSVKIIKHGTIRYVWCGILLLCYNNFVRKIFDYKNAATLETGLGVRQGHWKCHHSIQHLLIDVLQ